MLLLEGTGEFAGQGEARGRNVRTRAAVRASSKEPRRPAGSPSRSFPWPRVLRTLQATARWRGRDVSARDGAARQFTRPPSHCALPAGWPCSSEPKRGAQLRPSLPQSAASLQIRRTAPSSNAAAGVKPTGSTRSIARCATSHSRALVRPCLLCALRCVACSALRALPCCS